jgi:hypothetical protein
MSGKRHPNRRGDGPLPIHILHHRVRGAPSFGVTLTERRRYSHESECHLLCYLNYLVQSSKLELQIELHSARWLSLHCAPEKRGGHDTNISKIIFVIQNIE